MHTTDLPFHVFILLQDPQVTFEDSQTSLFDLVEDTDATDCIAKLAACTLVDGGSDES